MFLKSYNLYIEYLDCKKQKIPNLFEKNYSQEDVKCHIQHEVSWLRWIVIEHVNYYIPLIFPERNCNRETVIVMYSKKMKAKRMKEDVWKIFVNLQVSISQLHNRLTSSRIIFRNFKYMNAFEWLLLLLV